MSKNSGPSRFDGIAKQIGLVPSRACAPPNGATAFALRPGIGGDHRDHALARRHQRIGRQPPDMALAEHRRRRDVLLLRLVDRHPHRAVGHHVAKSPVPIDDHRGRRLFLHVERRAGNDVADLDAIDIARDQDDAVRIMPDQVGTDVVARDGRGLLRRCARLLQQRPGDLHQLLGLHVRHGHPPLSASAVSKAAMAEAVNPARFWRNLPAGARPRRKQTMASQPNVYASVAGTVGRSDKDQGAVGVFRRDAESGTWEHVIRDTASNVVFVHPTDPNIVFAGTHDGVYRSTDRGKHLQARELSRQEHGNLVVPGGCRQSEADLCRRLAGRGVSQRGQRRDVAAAARSSVADALRDAVRLPRDAHGAASEANPARSSPRWKWAA